MIFIKNIERFQVAWYDRDAIKQKEVVSNDKTQRSAAPCKASGLRRLHGVKLSHNQYAGFAA